MAVAYHPQQASIVTVDFDQGFVPPEMVKRRLAVVLSPAIQARPGLCTVVPLSRTGPKKVMPYHCELHIPFNMPQKWGNVARWVKGDMVCAISLHRIDLLRLGKDKNGERIYQKAPLPVEDFKRVRTCVLHGLGLSSLTKSL
ncbi:MAG: type II toxin-antitoxin system PemK/MazF family toxin [Alphaproteobacteria bacterium]|nr:type II toxin-antitoxin system PemK/MazF family toxin [Alphaproteobacteria bacterium]